MIPHDEIGVLGFCEEEQDGRKETPFPSCEVCAVSMAVAVDTDVAHVAETALLGFCM